MELPLRSVLVLNTTYEPLNIVSVQRAVVLLLKEKAEVVEAARSDQSDRVLVRGQFEGRIFAVGIGMPEDAYRD